MLFYEKQHLDEEQRRGEHDGKDTPTKFSLPIGAMQLLRNSPPPLGKYDESL